MDMGEQRTCSPRDEHRREWRDGQDMEKLFRTPESDTEGLQKIINKTRDVDTFVQALERLYLSAPDKIDDWKTIVAGYFSHAKNRVHHFEWGLIPWYTEIIVHLIWDQRLDQLGITEEQLLQYVFDECVPDVVEQMQMLDYITPLGDKPKGQVVCIERELVKRLSHDEKLYEKVFDDWEGYRFASVFEYIGRTEEAAKLRVLSPWYHPDEEEAHILSNLNLGKDQEFLAGIAVRHPVEEVRNAAREMVTDCDAYAKVGIENFGYEALKQSLQVLPVSVQVHLAKHVDSLIFASEIIDGITSIADLEEVRTHYQRLAEWDKENGNDETLASFVLQHVCGRLDLRAPTCLTVRTQ